MNKQEVIEEMAKKLSDIMDGKMLNFDAMRAFRSLAKENK